MTKIELQEKLKQEKNAELMLEIEYENKQYVRAKLNNQRNKFEYYEIKMDEITEIQDKNILEYFKKIYEIQEKNIVY